MQRSHTFVSCHTLFCFTINLHDDKCTKKQQKKAKKKNCETMADVNKLTIFGSYLKTNRALFI